MSEYKSQLLSELDDLINLDYEYYQELKDKGVSKNVALIRATIRAIHKKSEFKGISQYSIHNLISDIAYDEYNLIDYKKHDRKFIDHNTVKLKNFNGTTVKLLKRFGLEYEFKDNVLENFSDSQLQQELQKRNLIDTGDELSLESNELDSNDDLTLDDDLDFELEDLDLDLDDDLELELDDDELSLDDEFLERDLDEDDDLELDLDDDDFDLNDDTELDFSDDEYEEENGFGIYKFFNTKSAGHISTDNLANSKLDDKLKILFYIQNRPCNSASYFNIKKLSNEIGINATTLRSLINELISLEYIKEHSKLYVTSGLTCLSITTKGWTVLYKETLFDHYMKDSVQFSQAYDKIFVEKNEIQKLFTVNRNKITFADFSEKTLVDKPYHLVSQLLLDTAPNDSYIRIGNTYYTIPYHRILDCIDVLRAMRDQNRNEHYNSYISELQTAYKLDIRTASKYLYYFVHHQDETFMIDNSDLAARFFGNAIPPSEYVIGLMIENGFIKEVDEYKKTFRVTELGRSLV
ncbi:hypothetical protein H5404_18030 [Vibrio parahaemolyticus]|uniref:hypothetical protein n=1 Tax=Vibrio parahaemolyticus TaxID=670 RepID=UPI00162444F9|nr:hypothetical protein [Vibrio parahaemolyticus]QNE57721.1 hypothetical protein H5404_18030 [Vibrio parahaemolyticus]